MEKQNGNKAWQRITKEIKGHPRVLVTNNINARDAKGQMSHVWIGIIIKSSTPDRYGKFMTFADGEMPICDLTHYCEIPQSD